MRTRFSKVLMILLILVLIVVAGFYIIFESDFFKSDKELFYKYLLKENISNIKDIDYKHFEMLSADDKNYDFSGNIKLTSLKESLGISNDLSLEMKANSNSKENKSSATYMIKFGAEDLLGIDYIRNGEIYALKSDEITDKKYISVENNNLKELAQKMGYEDVTEIPDKVITTSAKDAKNIDLEKLNKIKDKYTALIEEKIPEYKYITEKEILLQVDGKDIKTTRYSLKIREREIYEVVHYVLETLKLDEETLQFVVDSTDSEAYTTKELKDNIRDIIKDLEKDKLKFSETDNVTFSVYAYKGRNIRTEILDINRSGIIIIPDTKTETDKIEIQVIENKAEDVKVGYTTNMILLNTSKKDKLDLEISINTTYNQEDVEALESSNIFADTEKYKDSNSVIIFVADKAEKNNVKLSCVGKEKDKETFSFEGNLNKDVDVDIIDLDDTNSTLLNDSTKEEIDTLMNTVSTNAFSVLLQKANILFPSLSSMLNSFTMTENPLNSNEEELTSEFVKTEVNNALTEVLDEYVTDSMFNASVDPNEYINEEKIKGYCTRATQIILTDTGIQYVGDNGITYEGTVTTDIDTGYLMVTEMIEK